MESKILVGAKGMVTKIRTRLSKVRRFLSCLNEPIAQRTNGKDNRLGGFWEGRFNRPRFA